MLKWMFFATALNALMSAKIPCGGEDNDCVVDCMAERQRRKERRQKRRVMIERSSFSVDLFSLKNPQMLFQVSFRSRHEQEEDLFNEDF
jgi:hypothetical protein